MNIKKLLLLATALLCTAPLHTMAPSKNGSQEKPIVIMRHSLFQKKIAKKYFAQQLWQQKSRVSTILNKYSINVWKPWTWTKLYNLIKLGFNTADKAKKEGARGINSILQKYNENLKNQGYPELDQDDQNLSFELFFESGFDTTLLKLEEFKNDFHFVLISEKNIEDFNIIQKALEKKIDFKQLFSLIVTRAHYNDNSEEVTYSPNNDNWLMADRDYTFDMYCNIWQKAREKCGSQSIYFVDDEASFLKSLQDSITDNNIQLQHCAAITDLLTKLEEWKQNLPQQATTSESQKETNLEESIESNYKQEETPLEESSESDDEDQYEEPLNSLDLPPRTLVDAFTQTLNIDVAKKTIKVADMETQTDDVRCPASTKTSSYWCMPSRSFVSGFITGAAVIAGFWYLKNYYVKQQ